MDDDNRVVGKLGHFEIVMNMDPIYRSLEYSGEIAHTSTAGLSQTLLKSLLRWDSLSNESFEQRCQRVLNLKVKSCMCIAMTDECVLETDSLEVAIYKLTIYRQQSLLVIGLGGIAGILRLTDIFEQIAQGTGDWNNQDKPADMMASKDRVDTT